MNFQELKMEENTSLVYNYGCLKCSSKPECQNCDGFGRNSSIDVKAEKCYITKEQMKSDLGLNKNDR